MSPMIDQISIFSDVILAQQLFKDLKKSGKNGTEQDNSRILTFEDDEFIVERVTRVTVVNVRIRMIENSAIPFINLTYLNLSFNRISEINGISHLTNLRTLDLSHNKIFDLSPIKEMKFLEILRVENNLIESLKPLNNTVKLKQLLLGHNNIIWEELIYLENIENLDVINLSENPLDKKQKIFDFICAFQPSIRSIFGFKNDFNLKNISEKSHFNNSNSSSAKLENKLDVSNDIIISRNIDFFCTIDGKGMMARARAYAIKNEEKNDSKNKLEKKHQPVLEENTSRKSSENGVSTPDSVRSASPKRPPLSSVKKEKKKDNQNTLTLPNLNNLTTMGNSELNQISGITRKTSDISEKKNIKKLNLSDKLFFEAENVLLKSPLGSGRECSPGSYLEPIGETIRFGGNNYDLDAPIAYFTKNSENGYVR